MQPGKQSNRSGLAKTPRLIEIRALMVPSLNKSICIPTLHINNLIQLFVFKIYIRHAIYTFHKTWHFRHLDKLMHSHWIYKTWCYTVKNWCRFIKVCNTRYMQGCVLWNCCHNTLNQQKRTCINHSSRLHAHFWIIIFAWSGASMGFLFPFHSKLTNFPW